MTNAFSPWCGRTFIPVHVHAYRHRRVPVNVRAENMDTRGDSRKCGLTRTRQRSRSSCGVIETVSRRCCTQTSSSPGACLDKTARYTYYEKVHTPTARLSFIFSDTATSHSLYFSLSLLAQLCFHLVPKIRPRAPMNFYDRIVRVAPGGGGSPVSFAIEILNWP